MKPYYVKYQLVTGFGIRDFEERFDTLEERVKCSDRVIGAGYINIKVGREGI